MKINEKHLTSFAANSSAVDKQGYLNLRTNSNRSAQHRWFVLKGNLLFYFDKKGDNEPVGVIIVEGCLVELSEIAENYAFELNFIGASSTSYILAAQTQEEMEEWMRALTCASYDYIRSAVSMLQRKVEELNQTPIRVQNTALIEPSLIETVDETAVKSIQRLNPFNFDVEEELPDVFPPSCFEAKDSVVSRPRTFEEMHYDFGERILAALVITMKSSSNLSE